MNIKKVILFVSVIIAIFAVTSSVSHAQTSDGSTIPDPMRGELAGAGCPPVANRPDIYKYTWWDSHAYNLVVNSDGTGTVDYYGALRVCGNSGYNVSAAHFYNVVIDYGTQGPIGFTLGDGNANAGNFSDPGAWRLGFKIPAGTCQNLNISAQFTALHNGSPDGGGFAPIITLNNVCTPPQLPPNSPPTGYLTLTCRSDGSVDFHGGGSDPDGTPAYTAMLIDTTYHPSGNTGSSTLVGAADSGNYPRWLVQSFRAAGNYFTEIVYDKLPDGSDGTAWVFASQQMPNCDQPPSATPAADCNTMRLRSVKDPDDPTYRHHIRVDVYEGGPAGGGGTRQWSGFVPMSGSPGSLDIPMSAITGGTFQAGVPPGYGGGPGGSAAAGNSTEWAGQPFYVYVISIDSSGAEPGGNTQYGAYNVGPCAQPQCGSSNIGNALEVGASTSFNVGMSNVKSLPPASRPKIKIYMNGSLIDSKDYTFNSANSTFTSSPDTNYTPPAPGSYNLTWQFLFPGITTVNCSTAATSAGYHPYFNALNGDVTAGAGLGKTCVMNTSAKIKSWNNNESGGPAFGAGSQLAALAMGNISGYATGVDSSSGNSLDGLTNANAKDLAFANTTGGGQLGNVGCTPDYYNDAYGSATDISGNVLLQYLNLSNYASGVSGTSVVKRYNGDLTIGSTVPLLGDVTIPTNTRITLLVKGNVYLTNNIKNDTSAITPDTLPRFNLYVLGNIYVNSTVTDLNGLYDIQKSGANTGTLYTCANAIGIALFDATICNNKLTMTGAVAANQIILGRTYGSVHASNGVPAAPAESFVYDPNFWIANDKNSYTPKLQAISGLPPTL